MKAKDLMIGNWLNASNNGFDKHVIVFDFTRDEIQHSDEHQDNIPIGQFKPIPLTEEWLVDFGFIKLPTKSYPLNSQNWCKSDSKNNTFFVYTGSRGFETSQSFILHNYVHQLQNLYFASTGEGLTIK